MTTNLKIAVDKEKKVLTITIDYNVPGTASGSGKSTVFASTEGNQRIDDDLVLGLNLYRKR
ncbi:MAG: hypothetical protein V1685_02650 [Parcubacteria group bacterium]